MRYMYTRTQLYKMVSMYVYSIYIYTVYTFIHNSMFMYIYIVLNTVLIHIQTQFCCATVYMYLYRC